MTEKEKQVQYALGLMGQCFVCGDILEFGLLNGKLHICNDCIGKDVKRIWSFVKNYRSNDKGE